MVEGILFAMDGVVGAKDAVACQGDEQGTADVFFGRAFGCVLLAKRGNERAKREQKQQKGDCPLPKK